MQNHYLSSRGATQKALDVPLLWSLGIVFFFLNYKDFAPLELGKTFEMFKSTGSADIPVGIFTWSSLWSSKFASKMLALPVKDVAPLELI